MRAVLTPVVLFFLVAGSPLTSVAASLPDDSVSSPAPLFAEKTPLKLRLETDLRALLKDRDDDAEYREASLTFADNEGKDISQEIKVKTRGNFRLKRRNCDFPPLRINLKKGKVDGTPFAGQDKLKLVTHCDDRSINQQYVLEEYLIYKAYNLLTPMSFNVRLVEITYVDTDNPDDAFTKLGFLIEDDELMAERNSARIVDMKGIPAHVTSPQESILLFLFQYMMANTDWSIRALHNIELLRPNDQSILYPVPYDFDFAGIIGTRYATPAPGLGISSVEDRLYLGACYSENQLRPAIDRFNDVKEELYALYQDLPQLDDKRKKRAHQFFDEFYDILEDERSVRAEFVDRCRG